jgi:hypothetical protein
MGVKEAGALQLLNLTQVITELLQLTRSEALAHDCTVLTELHSALPNVEANLVQLQQVFLNLILNAFEASNGVPVSQRRVIIRTEPDGDSAVRASVRDFGTGCREIYRSGSSIDFFRPNGRVWGSGCSLRDQSLPRTAARSGRRMRWAAGPSSGCDSRRRRRLVYDAPSRAYFMWLLRNSAQARERSKVIADAFRSHRVQKSGDLFRRI